MPRKARIDAPGALHHIIARGIERREIFCDDEDRYGFLRRLGEILTQSQTKCYAWALIPNHFHLLIKTGNVPVATVMRRLRSGSFARFTRWRLPLSVNNFRQGQPTPSSAACLKLSLPRLARMVFCLFPLMP